jgi:hypothetical protein
MTVCDNKKKSPIRKGTLEFNSSGALVKTTQQSIADVVFEEHCNNNVMIFVSLFPRKRDEFAMLSSAGIVSSGCKVVSGRKWGVLSSSRAENVVNIRKHP